jgi:hypothetical protein
VIDATHIYAINATSWTEAILVVVDVEETSFDFFFFFFPLIKLRKENATIQSIDHILPIKTYVARFFNEKNIYSLSYVRFINRP